MHYFKRLWDEARGDSHNDWGASTWYFETNAEMVVIRQIEIYANGTVLKYDLQHIADNFGRLAEKALDASEFAPFAIAPAEFEQVWNSP